MTPPPPRICFLLDHIGVGGVQTLTITLCRRLLAEGCKVDLIRLTEENRMLDRLPAGVRTMTVREMWLHSREAECSGIIRFFVNTNIRLGDWRRCLERFILRRGRDTETASDRKRRLKNKKLKKLFFTDSFFTAAGLRAFAALWKFRLRFICLHPVLALLSIQQTKRFPAYSRQVARYMETEKPDAVYSAWGNANIIALLGRRAAKCKPRLVCSLHTGDGDRSEKKIICALLSHFIAEADAVHAVSRGVADEAVRKYGVSRAKVEPVYNPAFHDGILDLKQQKCDHPWIARKGDEKVLLWAGRATLQKDMETLLRAFRILCQRRDARLILLGLPKDVGWMEETTEIKELYESVQDWVLLPGYAENPYSWMAGADAFVLSSQWEGLGNVLIEALACGCPVVSTDCEHGPREILEDGRWGRLTPVGDAPALADAIDATLDNPPAAEELVARARDFSEERIMPQFMDLLGLPRNARSAEPDSSPAVS